MSDLGTLTIDFPRSAFSNFLDNVGKEMLAIKGAIFRMSNTETTSDDTSLVIYNGTTIKVPNADMWFWNEEWQRGEREVDELYKNGNFSSYNSIREFVDSLG